MSTMKTTGPRKMRCPRCNAVGENEILLSMRNETVWCPLCARDGERSACVAVATPKERPILFSAPMVRALLDGRKTQTRRLLKVPAAFTREDFDVMEPVQASTDRGVDLPGQWMDMRTVESEGGPTMWRCPYGVPGDRLWVKETHTFTGWDEDGDVDVTYDADGSRRPLVALVDDYDVWVEKRTRHMMRSGAVVGDDGHVRMPEGVRTPSTPSIFMQRWASRILLEVTDVRVERPQDITFSAIRAEGVDCPEHDSPGGFCCSECPSLRRAWAELWESINGPGSWASSPWVWAVSFKVVEVRR